MEIRKNTKTMKESDQPLWVRIRELLQQKGLDPAGVVLAYSYPEDLNFEYGIIVTADEQVFQYGFDYLHKNISDGIFTEWNDITANYQSSPYKYLIEKALLVTKE
jgi:hypothetical protein